MSLKKLIVVAHPDDETLFFSSLFLQEPETQWSVVCATDADGAGRGQARFVEFRNACERLNAVALPSLKYPDVFNKRLDVLQLKQDLYDLIKDFQEVYTHGILGEYGHIHHQDVSRAVHETGLELAIPVWSAAYNSKADRVLTLSKAQYMHKLRILTEVYSQETAKFLNFLACTYSEAFARVGIEEVRAIYDFLAEGRSMDGVLLTHNGMLREWIVQKRYESSLKAFFSNYFEDI